MSPHKKGLLKAAGVIGSSTFLSRILGMIRDMVCARQFGTTWQWDAFVYAFMLPNFFRRLVGEGALSSAFIPVYSQTLEKEGRDSAFRFANVTLTLLITVVVSFTLLVEAGLGLALATFDLPERLVLTFELLQRLFPYLIFISLFALGMGILNSHHLFFVPSFAPVILNVFWIIGAFFIVPHAGNLLSDQLHWLAWILLVAGLFQLSSEMPVLMKLGYRVRLIWDLNHAGLKRAGKLILPALMGFAVMQINLLVDMTLAFLIGPGANSSLWYGTRLMQFPLGIVAIAMGTALLPLISKQAANKDFEETKKTISFALRSVFFIVLPASIGLIVLAKPIIYLLFERGEFDELSTARTSATLVFYCLGLFAYSGQKIMVSGFHAVQDTKTPVKIGAVALLLNIVLNLILMHPLKEAGLALATSLSGILQFILLTYAYRKGIIQLPIGKIFKSFLKITVAALLMGVATYAVHRTLFGYIVGNDLVKAVVLALSMVSGVLIYLGCCFVLRVSEFHDCLNWMKSKRKANGSRST